MEKRHGSALAWVWFTLLRLGLYAVVLGVLLLVMPVEPWISAIVAAVIAFCLSFIFLSKPRGRLAERLHEQRQAPRDGDADLEDEVLDSPDFRA